MQRTVFTFQLQRIRLEKVVHRRQGRNKGAHWQLTPNRFSSVLVASQRDESAALPPPRHGRLWKSPGLASEVHVVTLGDDCVVGCLVVQNVRGLYHAQKTNLKMGCRWVQKHGTTEGDGPLISLLVQEWGGEWGFASDFFAIAFSLFFQ